MSLSEKEIGIDYCPQCKLSLSSFDGVFPKKDVKEKIQNAQRRLKEIPFCKIVQDGRYFGAPENGMDINEIIKCEINKVFKEEFGDKFTSNTGGKNE